MKNNKVEVFISKILNLLHIKVSERIEKLLCQIFKFVIVGATATMIDWIIYYILYKFITINPLIANIISFSISTLYNYYASVKWVFDVNENKSKKAMFFEFILFSLIGLLVTEILLWLFIIKISLNKMLSKIISTIIVMIFNFITRKIFLE